jgi:hypothetical protein
MEEFENLAGFLEHISLVMDTDKSEGGEAVSIMTLHSAKGLEFDTVFLPGWEEGLFPHQRTLDDQGRAGLEEERRLAHVGLTRARRRAKIYFAANRRMHGLWSSNIPSRFLDELPEADVEVTASTGGFSAYGNTGASRFDEMTHFGSSYGTPGWQRAQRNKNRGGGFDGGEFDEGVDAYSAGEEATADAASSAPPLRGRNREGVNSPRGRARSRLPLTIEGELVAKSTGTVSDFAIGDRVFHQKFGNGNVSAIDGNKLIVQFDKAGEKRVVDSYVERVWRAPSRQGGAASAATSTDPGDTMPISQKLKDLIYNAWTDGSPCLLATQGPDGPNISPKGSMLVFDDEHLAYWERSKKQALANLGAERRVAVIYANFKAQRDGVLESGFLRFYGTAELYESGPVREAIFRKLSKREQEHDGADKGIGVLIKIARAADVRGKPLP